MKKEKREILEEGLLLKYKPKFSLTYEFLSKNFGTFIILLLLSFPALSRGLGLIYLLVMVIYLIFVVCNLIVIKLKYNRTTYAFYKDKFIYSYHFFRNVVKEVSLEEIKEIKQDQGVLQKMYKQGDIIIHSNTGNIFNNIIKLTEIENIEEVFGKIQEITIKE